MKHVTLFSAARTWRRALAGLLLAAVPLTAALAQQVSPKVASISLSHGGTIVLQLAQALSASAPIQLCKGVAPPTGSGYLANPCQGLSVALDHASGARITVAVSKADLALLLGNGAGMAPLYLVIDATAAAPAFLVVKVFVTGPDVREMRLSFLDNGGHQPVGFYQRGQVLPPLQAQIRYAGRGMLRARWEVIQPGDPAPTLLDLVPEGDLAWPDRARQHRYTVLQRVDTYLPPVGVATLAGPSPRLLPHDRDGMYTVLLRIEPTVRLGDSGASPIDEAPAFLLPVLRYHIGAATGPAMRGSETPEPISVVAPQGLVFSDRPLAFSWHTRADVKLYRLELEREGQLVYAARVQPDGGAGIARFTLPGFAQRQLGTQPARWRVVTLDNDGGVLSESRWVDLQWAAVK